MRKDMSRVVITTKRWGDKDSKGRRARRNRGDVEELPTRESIRPKNQLTNSYDAKHYNLGEHLEPLRRFINSKVGQHWDKVYAEICEHLDRSSTTHAHIFQHLYGYIEVKCYWKDGVLYTVNYYGKWGGNPNPVRAGDIYVCPKSGMIRRMKERPVQYKKREPKVIRIDDLSNYEKLDGIWYLVNYRVYEDIPPAISIHRPYSKPNHPGWPSQSWWSRRRSKEKVVVSKKQLNKKQLKKLGVHNG